jgi:hypothetical protein
MFARESGGGLIVLPTPAKRRAADDDHVRVMRPPVLGGVLSENSIRPGLAFPARIVAS